MILCYDLFLGLFLLLLILFVLHVVQKIEETLKLVLNMESTKECMNILLLIKAVFQLWQSVLLEWEKCNILNGSKDIPTCPPKLIRKSTFSCLSNLKETQLEKLVRRLFAKTITLTEHLAKGRRLGLKSMYKFTRLLK